jgi:hypothetical protein
MRKKLIEIISSISALLISGCATSSPTPITTETTLTETTKYETRDILPQNSPPKAVDIEKAPRNFNPAKDLGGDIFNLQFNIPADWEIEYIPTLKALNLYTLTGAGNKLNRSQIFIRFFDAKDFLTLPTVTIHEQKDLLIGTQNYQAQRYDIEKKSRIPNFTGQPDWRNQRHIVTDFRAQTGLTRYYVVAANPSLNSDIYESILKSMTILSHETKK